MAKKTLWPLFWLIVLAGAAQLYTSFLHFHTWSAVLLGALTVAVLVVLVLTGWTAIKLRRDKGKGP